jgi:cytoskeletal protein RodZ
MGKFVRDFRAKIDTPATHAYILYCSRSRRMSSTPFGEHLKREREMRGVSLEEVSAATRIGTRFLEALENEQWDQLPGGVFNRGFIRAIARFLGLDEEGLVSEYALETKGRPEPGVVAEPTDESGRRWGAIAIVVLLVILIAAGSWFTVVRFGPRIAARLHKHSAEPVTPAPQAAPGDAH